MATGLVKATVSANWTDIAGAAASIAGVSWQNIGGMPVLMSFTATAPSPTDVYMTLAPGASFHDDAGSAHVWVKCMAGRSAVSATLDPAAGGSGGGASENHLGKVGGESGVYGGSFTRPADVTAYTVGDLVANNTVANNVVPVPCAVARINGGTGVIRKVRLSTTKTTLVGTEIFRVHLFKLAPTVAGGDNAAFSANGIASVALGYVDVTMSALYSDGAKGFAAVDVVFDAAAGAVNIYALVEARTAYVPISGETFTVALEVLRD